MEEKQLIIKLQQLKQIKPRENWVVFNKSKIFIVPQSDNSLYNRIVSIVSNISMQKRFSYAFAAFLFVFTGLVGANMLIDESNIYQPAAILKPDVSIESIKEKSQYLTNAVEKYKLENVDVEEVKLAAKNLTDEISKNPSIAKDVAVELKNSGTLASLEGAELKDASIDLYRTIDIQMIDDLEKATLTEDQIVVLEQAKESFNQGKYFEALEKILLINN